MGHPDAVIIPGSKTIIADTIALYESGMAKQLETYTAAGGTIFGICGGYQILGEKLSDPEGLEGQAGEYPGLGLLPLETTISHQKIACQRQVISKLPQSGLPVSGYEVHQGRSQLLGSEQIHQKESYLPIFDDRALGIVNESQSIWGCYLHGLFDNGAWRRSWLNRLRYQRGLSSLPTGVPNYREQREAVLDSIAACDRQTYQFKITFITMSNKQLTMKSFIQLIISKAK